MKHTKEKLYQHVCDTLEEKTRKGEDLSDMELAHLLMCVELCNGLCKMEKHMEEGEVHHDSKMRQEGMMMKQRKENMDMDMDMKRHDKDTKGSGKSFFEGN